MWHVTPDTWHLTRGGGVKIFKKFQVSSFYGLGVMIFEDLVEKADSLTDLISDKVVCRTAPATPGLLIMCR